MQDSLPASLIRGGTSRGLFVRLTDLPPEGPRRDQLLLELLGSPDPIQVDGVGGGHSHTSKVMAVGPGAEADVEYLFAQVDARQPVVDYGGNCGNLTAAVAVYAVEEGLVPVEADATRVEVRLFNINTSSRIRVLLPVRDGVPVVQGDYEMAGIPHPGAEIRVDYLDPAGAMFGRGALPLEQPVTRIEPHGYAPIDVSVVDITGPYVLLAAADLGVEPSFLPEALNTDAALLAHIEAIRGEVARLLGMVDDAATAATRTPSQPKLALCAPAQDYETSTGQPVRAVDVDMVATMSSVQRIHHAFAGTGAMCLAAAARLPGTIPQMITGLDGAGTVRIGHPKGIAAAHVSIEGTGDQATIEAIGVSRTARTIMTGQVRYRRR